MSNIYTSITQLVGKTPLFEIKNYEEKNGLKARVLVKLEYYNPAQSVKDRIALAMIEAAEKDGRLKPGYTIVEVTSGNTGIGLAAFAASKGYKFRVYIADDVSIERFQIIKAFGGEVIKLSQVPQITKTLEETGSSGLVALLKEDGSQALVLKAIFEIIKFAQLRNVEHYWLYRMKEPEPGEKPLKRDEHIAWEMLEHLNKVEKGDLLSLSKQMLPMAWNWAFGTEIAKSCRAETSPFFSNSSGIR